MSRSLPVVNDGNNVLLGSSYNQDRHVHTHAILLPLTFKSQTVSLLISAILPRQLGPQLEMINKISCLNKPRDHQLALSQQTHTHTHTHTHTSNKNEKHQKQKHEELFYMQVNQTIAVEIKSTAVILSQQSRVEDPILRANSVRTGSTTHSHIIKSN